MSAIAAGLLTLVAIARITSTYTIYNHTYDEPFHVSRGYLWLKGYPYRHPLHPPLAPVFFAVGPIISGVDVLPTGNKLIDGNAILYSGNYTYILSLARMGNLLFFVWAAFALWALCIELFDPLCAAVSVFIFTMLPPVLAHGGLATTDMAISATLTTSIWTFTRWVNRLNVTRSVALGVSLGLTFLSKFSAIAFLPACIIGIAVCRTPSSNGRSLLWWRMAHVFLAGGVMAYVVWAGYRFTIGPTLSSEPPILQSIAGSSFVASRLVESPVPAPEFFRGMAAVFEKNHAGHSPYFLGEIGDGRGSAGFFPVVLAIKTPIAFLLAFCVGVCTAVSSSRAHYVRMLLMCFLLLLTIAMCSRINLGVRHVLPLYPISCAIVAGGLSLLCKEMCDAMQPFFWGVSARTIIQTLHNRHWLQKRGVYACGIACIILCVSGGAVESFLSHPNYLTYFNALAGSHPEDIVVDSDLDWGQDLVRLGDELKRRKISSIHLAYFGTADPSEHGLPAIHRLPPYEATSGYVAISLTTLKAHKGYSWLNERASVARIGESILLFHVE